MKWVLLFLTVWGLEAQASYTVCPDHIFQFPQYKRAWMVLKNIKPRFELGRCQVELHVCEPSESQISKEKNSDDDIVGDLWLRNQIGVEQYITFYFPKESKGQVEAGNNWLRYRFTDTHFDEIHGDKEKVSINIDLWDDNATVAKILLSTFSSKEQDRFLGILPMSIQSACFR